MIALMLSLKAYLIKKSAKQVVSRRKDSQNWFYLNLVKEQTNLISSEFPRFQNNAFSTTSSQVTLKQKHQAISRLETNLCGLENKTNFLLFS